MRRARSDSGDFAAQLVSGRTLFESKKFAEAVPYLERARALFPEYVELDSPYWFLALIEKQRGDVKAAARDLTQLTALNENHVQANLELSGLLDQLGDTTGSAAALERAIYIYPNDISLHQRLADRYTSLGSRAEAVRERRAVVAMAPVDRAEALYQLALALYQSGDAAGARHQVLRALEDAPNFAKAQDLLLKLRSGGGT